MNKKFLVIKEEDIYRHLNTLDKKELTRILNKITNGRKLEGKAPDNTYVVVNTDESYIDRIIEIMKSNGHWG